MADHIIRDGWGSGQHVWSTCCFSIYWIWGHHCQHYQGKNILLVINHSTLLQNGLKTMIKQLPHIDKGLHLKI